MKKIISSELKSKIVENLVKLVGIAMIISIIGIFLNLVMISLPIFFSGKSEVDFSFKALKTPIQYGNISPKIGFLEDDYIFLVTSKPEVKVFEPKDYKTFKSFPLRKKGSQELISLSVDENEMISAFFADGTAKLMHINLEKGLDYNKISLNEVGTFKFDPQNFKLGKAVYFDEKFLGVILNKKNQLEYKIITKTSNFLGEVTEETYENTIPLNIKDPDNLMLDKFASKIYLTNKQGFLEGFELFEQNISHRFVKKVAESQIASSSFLLGGKSIFLSLVDGNQLLIEPKVVDNKVQINLRRFDKHPNQPPFSSVKSSKINRVVIGLSKNHTITLIYSTTNNRILKIDSNAKITDFAINHNQEKLITLSDTNDLTIYDIFAKYPEASVESYFGKLTYEGYLEPSYTWQSSSGDDNFEPKLSFVPLVIGSFKGTFYSMILVLPLTILGAIYLSQFASNKTRNKIKPAIEIMSSVPSVVIGFLAALWLGPNLEKYFLHIIIFFPILIFFAGLNFIFWFKNPKTLKLKLGGLEFLLFIPSFLLACLVTKYLGDYLLLNFFGNDLTTFLYENFNVRYEQQNAIVASIALGIAVTPLVFSITDDAIKTVPESIKAASLALGASQWQTVWRIIVPSASPGIIAAVILGVSRAVGETMIVLMASGNTPISDFNLFNGMRTLSANIAVEIPESPVGGTLYRTLFLSGLLLFLITFVFNFLAEFIRNRLRKRYNAA